MGGGGGGAQAAAPGAMGFWGLTRQRREREAPRWGRHLRHPHCAQHARGESVLLGADAHPGQRGHPPPPANHPPPNAHPPSPSPAPPPASAPGWTRRRCRAAPALCTSPSACPCPPAPTRAAAGASESSKKKGGRGARAGPRGPRSSHVAPSCSGTIGRCHTLTSTKARLPLVLSSVGGEPCSASSSTREALLLDMVHCCTEKLYADRTRRSLEQHGGLCSFPPWAGLHTGWCNCLNDRTRTHRRRRLRDGRGVTVLPTRHRRSTVSTLCAKLHVPERFRHKVLPHISWVTWYCYPLQRQHRGRINASTINQPRQPRQGPVGPP